MATWFTTPMYPDATFEWTESGWIVNVASAEVAEALMLAAPELGTVIVGEWISVELRARELAEALEERGYRVVL